MISFLNPLRRVSQHIVSPGEFLCAPEKNVCSADFGWNVLYLFKQTRQPGLGPRQILKVLADVSAHLEPRSLSWAQGSPV